MTGSLAAVALGVARRRARGVRLRGPRGRDLDRRPAAVGRRGVGLVVHVDDDRDDGAGQARRAPGEASGRSRTRSTSPQPPGDTRRLMVVEQTGRIMVVRGGRTLAQPFLDIRAKRHVRRRAGPAVGRVPARLPAERALLRLLHRPSAADNRIVEYRRRRPPTAPTPSSARVVLTMPNLEANHNGGLLLFGPDGLLYVGTGDGGGAQRPARRRAATPRTSARLLGKLLRIDPRRVRRPAVPDPVLEPVRRPRRRARRDLRLRPAQPVALLLRPPHRRPVIGDVGQDQVEEIDFARRGRGARRRTTAGGRCEGTPAQLRRARAGRRRARDRAHARATGYCSITGGYVVRDAARPGLAGRYVYGDDCEGAHPRRDAARRRARRRAASSAGCRSSSQLVVVRRGRARPRVRRRR